MYQFNFSPPRWDPGGKWQLFRKIFTFPQTMMSLTEVTFGAWDARLHRGFGARRCYCWLLLSPCPNPEALIQKKRPWDLSYCNVHRKLDMGLIKPTLLGFLMWGLASIYLCTFSAKQLRHRGMRARTVPRVWHWDPKGKYLNTELWLRGMCTYCICPRAEGPFIVESVLQP